MRGDKRLQAVKNERQQVISFKKVRHQSAFLEGVKMKGIKFEYVSWKIAVTRAITDNSVWTVTGAGACAFLVKGGAA